MLHPLLLPIAIVTNQMLQQELDRLLLLRRWLGDGLVGEGAMACELDDAVQIGRLVVGQKFRPSRVAQEAGGFLVEVAQQREVVSLYLIGGDRLLKGLLQ